MAKDKKAKKGREEETGEEVVTKNTQDITASGKNVQKGKKTKKDDDISDSIDGVENLSLEDKLVRNSKKNKKSKSAENDELSDTKDSIPADEDSKSKKKEKRSKKGKSVENEIAGDSKHKSTKLESHIVSSEDEDEKTTKRKIFDKPSGFSLLAVEDDDVDDSKDNTIVEDQPVSKMSESDNLLNGIEQGKTESKGKKSKKKERRRKNDDDDEDLEKILEELALEMSGQKPSETTAKEESASAEVNSRLDVEKVDPEPKQSKKKKSKVVEADSAIKLENDEATDLTVSEEQHTVKTAAEKKREKKEKEKQKKAAKFEQSRSSSSKVSVTKDEAKQGAEKPAEEVSVPIPEVEEPDDDDEKKEDEGDDKKKKKKKKKDEDDKKDKKRPGKRQIAAMQEALKKVREEEERLRLLEEEKIRAAEEAEILRLEKLRLEQERKEKKKLKEKEKRERLKAEGKLLSKTQRQNRARMEATLAALRQQGVEVPEIGEKKERAPRLGDRKRQVKKRSENVHEDEDKDGVAPSKDSSPEMETESPEKKMDESVEVKEEEEEEEEDEDVKDAWDESSSEDEQSELSTKVEIVVKEKSEVYESDESGSDESESTDDEESESEESSESEDEGKKNEERLRERVIERIRKRREDAETNRNPSKLRSPVVCVLGHVDTGKTKILDKIRKTNIQDGEAGGITQQIGATMIPKDALNEQCKMVKNFPDMEMKLPGLLIIDTPGHESFSNLRSRGSSLCDIAVLVVDIMHGLEPQTIESINLLKQKKTPFIVALNKIDRLYEWKSLKNRDVEDVIKSQARNTKMEFDDRAKDVILQFANQGLNAVLHYENPDPRTYISMVPTSALTGDGMGNLLALVVQLTQTMMIKRLMFSEELQATVLEVKAIPGLGTTVDTILVNGRLQEGNTIVFAGYDGPVVTQIRSLLMPQPLKELRVKNIYKEYKEVEGAQGVKITGKDLDKAIAGLQLLVAHHPDEIPLLKEEVASSFKEAMGSIKVADRGVYVQASTLGSLEALLEFLRASKIPYSGIRIGPVVKKDVMKASIMLEHDSQYAVILAFDVKIEKDAQELADSLGVKIFQADIIYHLFDKFIAYREELKNKKRDEFKSVAVFPCKLRILPNFVFNSRDPIVCGVIVEAGVIKEGTPLCVPSKEFLEIGTVTTIEVNHKAMETARKGQEVCIKIEPIGGESPKMYGRHFDHTDILVSKITRQSIDVCKEYFRDDLQKTDWQLMVELKKIFQIL